MSETELRRPAWLRKQVPMTAGVMERKASIAGSGLHTVCESAKCPNLSECFRSGTATFLIMGNHCTRNCGFCAVEHGTPTPLDAEEGKRIAEQVKTMSIRYAVITSVTRDDLPDGGAGHFARIVTDIRATLPDIGIELLVPDFQGRAEPIAAVAALPLQVFGHNLETVASLYPAVRQGARYERSLAVLRMARGSCSGKIKSGIMVGLGETHEELTSLFGDLAAAGVSILTIGQYLRPRWDNVPVKRYVPPEEFAELALMAQREGISVVESGPYVRSSYHAESVYRKKI
jgi:lipoic acid synthetase